MPFVILLIKKNVKRDVHFVFFLSLPTERQRGVLLERYLGEHSSGLENLNSVILWQKKRLRARQAFRMRV